MIFHVSGCLLAHGEKGLISNTFCHTKREYSFSVHPIGCTPAFSFCLYSLLGLYGTEWIAAARRDPEAYPMEATGKYISSVHLIIVFFYEDLLYSEIELLCGSKIFVYGFSVILSTGSVLEEYLYEKISPSSKKMFF